MNKSTIEATEQTTNQATRAFEPVSIGPLDVGTDLFFIVLWVFIQILLKRVVVVEMS